MKKLTIQKGMTLIEVAITVLILSTSLLAMATLQTRSLQFNKSAAMRSQANIFAYDIIDRIRLNRGGVQSEGISNYTTATYDAAPSGTSADADVSEWRENIARALPGGKGQITCVTATHICTVSIQWPEEQIFGAQTQDDPNPDALSVLTYSTSI